MVFIYIFTISLSLAIMALLFAHAFKHRHVAGAGAFLAQIIFVAVWATGSMLELFSIEQHEMLIWRNVQQIGVFGVPVTCVYFAAGYGRYVNLKKYLLFFWIIPIAAVALIFTDEFHHIMRESYTLSGNQLFGTAILVETTPAGFLFVAYNFCLVAVSLLMLGLFAARVSKKARQQVVLVMVSISLVFGFAFLKTAFLETRGVNIPIVAFYLPSSLVLFYNLFRHRLFMVSPIAREKVFDVIEQGIIVTDDAEVIVDRNPYAIHLMETFFGIAGELAGKSMADAFSIYPKWVELMAGGGPGELEVQSPMQNAGTLFIRIKVYPLLSERGRRIGMVSLLRDITARRLQEFELKKRADKDSLTGLLNRNGFMEAFRKTLDNAAGGPVSVLMMDLDGLKPVNDTYGHFSGDRVLVAIAEMLRRTLRQQDAIGRIGGDEFAASLPGIRRADALGIAERIRREAANLAIEMENGETIHITLSIGLCDNSGLAPGVDRLLNTADKALYRAKKLTRNCCVVWE